MNVANADLASYGECTECNATVDFRRDGLCIDCLAISRRQLLHGCTLYIESIDKQMASPQFDRNHQQYKRDQHMAENIMRAAVTSPKKAKRSDELAEKKSAGVR